MPTTPEQKKISRRKFLRRTGWIAAGLTITATVAFPFVRAAIPVLPTFNEPGPEDGMTWVQVLPDGRIRFFCPRMEMGQGAGLGLAQVVAEELNITQEQIECVLPATNQAAPFQMTVGSESIRNFFKPVSLAAARLRQTLQDRAAERAGIAANRLKDENGGFVLPDGSRLTYGMLVTETPVVISDNNEDPESPPPQYAESRRGNHRAIGKSWKHHELEAIVTGKTVYSRDVSVEGMVFGEVIHPPAFGARVKSVNAAAAEAMDGIRVITVDQGNNFAGTTSFVGVVSEDQFILPQAVAAIDVEWELRKGPDQDALNTMLDVARISTADEFEHVMAESGDIKAGAAVAKHRVSARYDTPFAAHAPMEPRAAVASVRDDKVEIWSGTQDPYFVQNRVASAIGRDAEDVVVHPLRMGGGFGGRVLCRASDEAALLSAAVGKPVRVQWSREAEFQNTYFQPAYSHQINAGVTEEGKISHWQHDFVSSPILTGLMPANVGWAAGIVMADSGTSRGALPPYQMANRRTRFSDIRTDVPIGPWRALGAAPNAFAIESMIDELATLASIDPLEFRLNNLPESEKRLVNVLQRVAEISNWDQTRTAKDFGRGMACAVYKGETPVAVVADVAIDHQVREIRVTRIWCAQDCGLVINPDQVENLVMGNIIWGCSMALKEQLSFDAGSVEQDNFHTYEILRHNEAPKMVVSLVEPGGAPFGVGESALPAVAPAITNALFAATGKRVRKLPLSYENVFAAQAG